MLTEVVTNVVSWVVILIFGAVGLAIWRPIREWGQQILQQPKQTQEQIAKMQDLIQ